MDEAEFDALMRFRPFGTADATRWEAQARADTELVMTLGTALWGKTAADVQRQLLVARPEIPPGHELSDYQRLLQCATKMVAALAVVQRLRGLPSAGPLEFSLWEARCEVVRRVIDSLESR